MSNFKSKFLLGVMTVAIMFVGVVAVKANTAAAADCTITSTLRVGSKGEQVKCLQTAVGVKADGSFGKKTAAAVKVWQAAKGLKADGVFGAKSRAIFVAGGPVVPPVVGNLPAGCNAAQPVQMYSMTLANTPCIDGAVAPVGNTGPLSVALAQDNPASGYVIKGQAGADLAHFAFTGSGTVNSVTLHRTGVSDSNTLTNLYLYDGATRLTSGYSFNTYGDIVMNNLGIVVNGSKTISVKADVWVSTPSSSIGVALASYTAGTTATISSVMGNQMTVGTATVSGSAFTVTNATVSPSAASINAGSMNQALWTRTLTISQHAAKLHAVTLKMIGSAPSNAITNVNLFIDGANSGTTTVNANSQFVFALATPVNLATGSHLIEVRGDVVAGAYRNFYLSLEQGTDIAVEDSQMPGVYVNTVDSAAATTVNANGGTVTINNGTVTVNQDTAFNNTTTLVSGVTNTVMASYKIVAYGEDVKITSLTFTPTLTLTNPASPDSLVNVGLYVNGGQIGSNQTATTATPLIFNSLGSQLLVTAGTPALVQIKGDVVNGTPANVLAGTVKFDVTSGTAQGMSSSQTTTVSGAGGQTLTVSATNVTFASTVGFAASIKAPNQTVKIGSWTVQTASAEGAVVNSINVDLGGTMVGVNQITNLIVKDDSTGLAIGNPVGNPVALGNNFSVNVPVNASSTKVLSLYADFGSSSATKAVTPSMQIVYRGATSNLSTTSSMTAGVTTTSNVATIAAGGTVLNSGLSPTSQFVIGGSTIANLVTFNVVTSNNVAGAVIKDMTFTVPANTVSSVTVNGKTAQVVGTTAVVYDAGIVVPADNTGINFPVGVTLVCATSGGGCSGASNTVTTVTLTSYTFNDGAAIQTSTPASAVSPNHLLVTTKPTVTATQPAGVVLAAGGYVEAIDVKVQADAAGSLRLDTFPISSILSAGAGSPLFTAGAAIIKDANNTVIGSSGSCASSATCAITITLTGGYTIGAGQSQTFKVFLPVAAVGTGTLPNTFMNTALVSSAAFAWTDVAGNNTSITNTTYVYQYPSTFTSSIHN